jgi:hypothetical protein
MDGISFVVTVFNKEAEIEACAKALFSQEGDFPREFIFVDDGSTDRTPEILNSLVAGVEGARVLRVMNNGPARAMNAGARQARHPLIKPVDGDDVLARDAALVLCEGLRQGGDLIFASKVVLNDQDNPDTVVRADPILYRPLDDALECAIDISLSGCSEVIFRAKDFWAVGGCDERLFIQDQSYIRRMIASGRRVLMCGEKVAFSPPSPAQALCNNVPQIDHDNNAALMLLVEEYPDMSARLKRLALKKCASRTWKWLHRGHKVGIGGDPVYWTYLSTYLPFLPVTPDSFLPTLFPYRRLGRVRGPGESGLRVLKPEHG